MEYTLVLMSRALVEVAGYALIGQGILYVFAGASRDKNFVYRLFAVVTRPALRAARWVTPRFIDDRFIGLVAFFLVFWLWIALTIAKRYLCVTQQLTC